MRRASGSVAMMRRQPVAKIVPSLSIRSSAMPQPRTTQVRGSSATTTGSPVSSIRSRSRSRSNAPPPVSIMPRLLERNFYARHDLIQRIGQRFQNLVARDREAARNPFGQVAALDFHLAHFRAGKRRADVFLDQLGGRFADQHSVVAADVVDDRL